MEAQPQSGPAGCRVPGATDEARPAGRSTGPGRRPARPTPFPQAWAAGHGARADPPLHATHRALPWGELSGCRGTGLRPTRQGPTPTPRFLRPGVAAAPPRKRHTSAPSSGPTGPHENGCRRRNAARRAIYGAPVPAGWHCSRRRGPPVTGQVADVPPQQRRLPPRPGDRPPRLPSTTATAQPRGLRTPAYVRLRPAVRPARPTPFPQSPTRRRSGVLRRTPRRAAWAATQKSPHPPAARAARAPARGRAHPSPEGRRAVRCVCVPWRGFCGPPFGPRGCCAAPARGPGRRRPGGPVRSGGGV